MSTNIVESLLSEVLSSDSLSAMKKTTGATGTETTSVITAALPVLLQALSNDSSGKGSSTVETLLNSYSSSKKENIASKIENADEEDGLNVLNTILGSGTAKVESGVAKTTGVDKEKVVKILATVVPIVLSFVSYQNKKNKKTAAKKSTDSGDQLTELLGDLVNIAAKKDGSGNELVSDLLSALFK